MLAYLLALVVALGSFALYMAAFFFPEVHRKNDFIWSGVGLFYALVLWVCAERITGGVLLGQTASVALLGWLGWQTLTLRRQVAPLDQQTAISGPEAVAQATGQLGQQVDRLQSWVRSTLATKPAPTQEAPYVPLTPADFAARQDTVAPSTAAVEAIAETTTQEAPDPWVADATADAAVTAPTPPAQLTPPAQSAPRATEPEKEKTGVGLGGILSQVQGAFKGLTQKRDKEAKAIYVRKQYRAPDAAPETPAIADDPLTPPSSAEPAIVEDASIPADSVLQEEIAYEAKKPEEPDHTLEAIPPHPPSVELVEAALADAEEKHLPADPPPADEERSQE